ncbi:expressed unknown protein [Seminavis robusta]|uniref:Ribonuclease II winged helix domain-containing protein n=1 Tax=Seminavis robusta TaxID=568900 RepID=A0A9N8HE25_9STRA|nr:expressed unknown protein [Seminavis robusta]|eukprot:Sro492_g153790.1 n/a (235) ;mRNA; r:18383-19196
MRLSAFSILLSLWLCGPVSAFVVRPVTVTPSTTLLAAEKGSEEVKQQHALSVGTLVEFQEKSRVHIGTIKSSEHKSSGGARYKIEDIDGKSYNVADKHVTFATPVAPSNANKVNALMTELEEVQHASEEALCKLLDVSPDLLEMAWEEAAAEEAATHELTAKSFVSLVHSHAASTIEEYTAWRLLKMDMAHVFFKDIKQNGRVASFKAKARKAVDNAKVAFCASHADDVEFCFV